MAGLTVTEKTHWKERIARRLDKKIETLAAADPNLLDRVKRQARERAVRSLGLGDLQAELDQLEEQTQAAEKRKDQLQRSMLAQVQGVQVNEVDARRVYYDDRHPEVDNAIERRQAVHEEELLAETTVGQEILKLRREKEELLDTIWLATSGRQLRDLWQRVATLLGEEPSPLQRAALAIEPEGNDAHAETSRD